MDTIVYVRRREDYRTLTVVQREGDDLPETVLALDPATQTLALTGTRADHEAGAVGKRLLTHLKARGEPATRDELQDALEVNRAALTAALGKLKEAGQISREGGGKRGDPFLFRFRSDVPQIGVGTENGNGNTSNDGANAVPAGLAKAEGPGTETEAEVPASLPEQWGAAPPPEPVEDDEPADADEEMRVALLEDG